MPQDRLLYPLDGAEWGRGVAQSVPTRLVASDRIKRAFDVSASTLILLTILPLGAMICIALLMQGRPFLIRHNRVGRNGQLFPCLKFRTMVVDAEARLNRYLAENPAAQNEWNASRKLKDDPRVTSIGKVLRKSSLDEIPQLLNVIRGEMSLVGPRPIVPAEAIHYGSRIERYHAVRPGMTGVWQVSGRSDVSYERRVELDCKYVAERNFISDIYILFATIPAVLRSKGSY